MSSSYYCQRCGASECKLWRPLASSAVELVCLSCLRMEGHIVDLSKSDQVYDEAISHINWGPAVPDLDGSWWGYTSVPGWWVAWWKALPDRPEDCTHCLGKGRLLDFECCFCRGSGKREDERR